MSASTRGPVVSDNPCPDCGVAVGHPHELGCDIRRCLHTGGQAISCDSAAYVEYGDEDGEGPPDDFHEDCGRDVWSGEFPGVADAKRLGFWCYWDDDKGFVRCGPDHPEATPDLNRIHGFGARWDRSSQRWESVNA